MTAAQMVGALQSLTLTPGASVDDVLVFERPNKAVSIFDLELPGSAFEGNGRLQFEIPGTMLSSS
jgi:hypothetical protein